MNAIAPSRMVLGFEGQRIDVVGARVAQDEWSIGGVETHGAANIAGQMPAAHIDDPLLLPASHGDPEHTLIVRTTQEVDELAIAREAWKLDVAIYQEIRPSLELEIENGQVADRRVDLRRDVPTIGRPARRPLAC